MGMTPTPHNKAIEGKIAKTVLMSGDPLRAKMIAEKYLENPVCFNTVRNMLGYTGTYKGKQLSVMGHGMGMPSMGIYSYELYEYYHVDQIIRMGSAGALGEQMKARDLVIGMGACTNSNYASQYKLPGTYAPIADYTLLCNVVKAAQEKNIPYQVGNILSSDTFYSADTQAAEQWKKMNVLAIEMEAAALYMNAARAGKQALCIVTISDHIFTGEALSAEERQMSFTDMVEVALESILMI